MMEYSEEIIVSNGFRLNYLANQTVIRIQVLTCAYICIYIVRYLVCDSVFKTENNLNLFC